MPTSLLFEVAERLPWGAEAGFDAYLVVDDWNDWFRFNTMYTLFVDDATRTRHRIGSVKIGEFGMSTDQRRPNLDGVFSQLDERFFSVGQDDTYYENLNSLGAEIREAVLVALHDLAYAEPELLERALREDVTLTSLLRYVTPSTVNNQFRRISMGGARLSTYSFAFQAPNFEPHQGIGSSLEFQVEPESQPPTNVHVIIGRNGVGKTHLLNAMTCALFCQGTVSETGHFTGLDESAETPGFASLVSVTFSAFDPFGPIPDEQLQANVIRYSYVGLKRAPRRETQALGPKSPEELTKEFEASANVCNTGDKASRWFRALRMLESDPNFRDAQVTSLAPQMGSSSETPSPGGVFSRLSSGHKIVLLTITKLVETVAERTLVLLDEPEAHLHPPLLSAFVRALSELLINRNGVAIIATHSPVVLQEVPRRCVWKLRRSGIFSVAERPEIETFGESVGVLTREVFGLEVTESGFHRFLTASVDRAHSYERVLDTFNGELGSEAKAIVRGLIASQDEDVS